MATLRALWVRLVLAVVLFAFGMLGITNSVHLAAKIVYGLLLAAATALFVVTLLRRSSGTSRL